MRDPRFVRTYGKITVPSVGAFFGADDTTRGFTGPSGIETQVGRTMAIRNRHAGWEAFTNPAPLITQARQDALAGTIPMLSIGAQGWPTGGLGQVASGGLDAAITDLVGGYQAFGSGFILRPMMEMNGAHNQAYYGDPTLYRTAFERIAGIARSAAPDGVLIFCPQQKSSAGVDPEAWQAYEPSDYDWGGVDLYRASFEIALPFLEHYLSVGKPFIVCESGFEQGEVVLDSEGHHLDKDGSVTGNSLILDTMVKIKQHENTIGYLVWNNVGPAGDDFIDTSAKSLIEYTAFARDPYFLVR